MAVLICDGCRKDANLLSEVEQDICRYIEQNKGENFEDVLAMENRWKVFYHLSEMRTSILNWYDFGENASILEVGGEFGAITGMLCRKAQKVSVTENVFQKAEAIQKRYHRMKNLTVYAGDIEKISFPEKFDYVIITGSGIADESGAAPEEKYAQYVGRAKNWLKEDGRLLLAVDNYNGAKYQCGYPRPVQGSINENGCEAMMTKTQVEKMLMEAGFKNRKFYYPFPDYRLTQEIYTDARLPEGSVRDRILTYYVQPKMLYRDEYQIYENEIENGDIRNVCNSYLVECSIEGLCSDAGYIAVSTDRGRKHSFASVIQKERVIKKAIYDDGKEYLKKSFDNILNIQARGIHIVPHTYQNDKIVMPVIKGAKLVEQLFLLASESKEKFVRAIDKMYTCLIKSSDYVEDQGKIYLENGYIDMIPLNCFAEDGEYYFFDQEFCEKRCPLDYIMFRVLRYTYLAYPELESYVSLEDMKTRYRLRECWQEYLSKEDRFIWDNRQHRVNHSFYQWLENRGVEKPIVSLDGVCGLCLSEGFDVKEEDSYNTWAWAVKQKARICMHNFTDNKIRIRLQFTLYPPPGTQEHRIEIDTLEQKEQAVFAPETIGFDLEIDEHDSKFINFHVEEPLTKCDNGDPRAFAFQLLNPQIMLNRTVF